MKTVRVPISADWLAQIRAQGLTYEHGGPNRYWVEDYAYEFRLEEILAIERATVELHKMCLAAVEHVIREDWFDKLRVPEALARLVKSSWEADLPGVYGRFDFSLQNGVPKLLEYNADTPTMLLETAVIQWYWLMRHQAFLGRNTDQFNSVQDKLIDMWRWVGGSEPVHFACMTRFAEDLRTTEFMADCARQAGLPVRIIEMKDIGWTGSEFVDLENKPITRVFKLYPWEFLSKDRFFTHIETANAQFIEPAWKAILSNKAILAVLWALFPDHPHLLPTYFDEPRGLEAFVEKPLTSREGANIRINDHGKITATGGSYAGKGYVYQAYAPLPQFNERFALIGSWVVGELACGMGIRESSGLITDNMSRFVPHFIRN